MMFDIAIYTTMLIAAVFCGILFWNFGNKGFKGVLLTALGSVMGAAAAYWLFILVSLVMWMFVNTGAM